MSRDHAGAVEQAFTQQAAAFEDPRYADIFIAPSGWMFAPLELRPDDLLLDVAAGTGHAARALAGSVRCAIALDATAAMLAEGKAAADRAGIRNLVFVRGDAAALPFPDGTFDAVVTRYAVHHFEAPERPLAEMVRCLRPGGRLAVGDIAVDADPAIAATQNRLERLRDPSHVRALAPEELAALLQGAGLEIVSAETREVERPLAPWLDQSDASAEVRERIAAAFAAEIAGGPPTGLRPRERDGALHFVHRIASVVAIRPH